MTSMIVLNESTDEFKEIQKDMISENPKNGRKGLGIELKPSYYKQAIKNVREGLAAAKSVGFGVT